MVVMWYLLNKKNESRRVEETELAVGQQTINFNVLTVPGA
jgi:hypothetical protein